MPDAGQSVVTSNIGLARRKVGWIDDFFGDSTYGGSFFQISLAGGTVTNFGVNELDVFGAWQLSTAASATGRATILSGNSGSFSLGQGAYAIEFYFKVSTLSTALEEFSLRVGLLDSTSGAGTNAVVFTYIRTSSTFWRVECKSASVATTNTTTVTVGTGWQRLKIVVNPSATSVSFLINDVEVTGSPITTNIPVGAGKEVTIMVQLLKSVGTTGRTCTVDYIAFDYELSSPRG